MRWIVTRHLPQSGDMTAECAIVDGDEAIEAAEAGCTMLMEEYPVEGEDHRSESVAVILIGGDRAPEWFRFGLRAERVPDELQCCGGSGLGGHSGFCDLREGRDG